MTKSAVVLVVLGMTAAGCRKQSSPEFYRLESAHSVMVSSQGDSAYLEPEMKGIAAALAAIPQKALERPRAVELAASIAKEIQRVEKEHLAEVAPSRSGENTFQWSPPVGSAPPAKESAPDDEADAGPSTPWGGMSESEFVTRFGSCFGSADAIAVPDAGYARVQALKETDACQRRFGTPGARTAYLFLDGGMWGTKTEVVAKEEPAPVPIAQPAVPFDAGAPILLIPGAPLPEGYEKTTVY